MEKIIRTTLKEALKTKGNTDWKRFDSITDEQLEEMVKNDPDDVYLTDEDFRKGGWIKRYAEPKKKEQITIRRGRPDSMKMFRKKGKRYQSRINNERRAFMAAQQERTS